MWHPHWRFFFKLAVLAAGPTGAAETGARIADRPGGARPNVLFIAVDDLNDWLGCLGGHPDARTPNMDRLAARGTLFVNAHCNAPLCGPSRASLMSGLRPSTSGIYTHLDDNALRGAGEAMRDVTFLHEFFSRRGYEPLAVGKLFHQHVPKGTVDQSGGRGGWGPMPDQRINWRRKGTLTDWGAYPENDAQMPDYQAASWAVDRLREERPRPFFLGVGFIRPHVPWHVPSKWFELFSRDQLRLPPYLAGDLDDVPETARLAAGMPMMPTTEWAMAANQWRDIVQAYLACVSFADAQVGRVLDALEASPAAHNTVIVLWGDNGYHLGEKSRFAKQALWERATRVPLIIAAPGRPGGRKCLAPVSLLDLYPTLLELAGLPPNPRNEGNSLVPLLENPARDWPHAVLTTWGRNNHALRDARWRYIRMADGAEELYDHQTDPNEWHNLAGRAEQAAVKQRMRKFLPTQNAPWAAGLTGGSPALEEQYARERNRR
jgi:arylsulfatase A-like enzyme